MAGSASHPRPRPTRVAQGALDPGRARIALGNKLLDPRAADADDGEFSRNEETVQQDEQQEGQ
jgi:hypothetical protein